MPLPDDIARMGYNEIVSFVENINIEYPNPRQPRAPVSRDPLELTYCVGGAFMHAAGSIGICWPGIELLSTVLRACNKALQPTAAEALASNIINANDRGEFDVAREELFRALTYARGPEPPGTDVQNCSIGETIDAHD